jgi:hypothetical protein
LVRGGWRTRDTVLNQIHDMGTRRYVLSVDNDNEFRSRCEWIWVSRFGSRLFLFLWKNKSFSLIPQRELYLTANSHITLSNVVSPLNLVSIFRCPSLPHNPVYVRLNDKQSCQFTSH